MDTAPPPARPAPPSSPWRMPRAVVLLGLTSLFTDLAGEMIFPLLPAFLAGLGGMAFLGILEGAADAVASLLKIAVGRATDRRPHKMPFVLVGYGLAGAVRPLMGLVAAPWQALLVRIGDRVGKGIRTAPRDVVIAQSVPAEHSGRAFGFHRAMDHAGAVLGPLAATGLLALGVATRSVFLLAAIPGVLAFATLLFIREPAARATPSAAPLAPTPTPPPTPLPAAYRRFVAVLVLFALGGSTDAFLLVRAHELGTDLALVPILYAALHVTKLVATWGFGILADRVPRLRLIVLGWLVYAAAYLALGLVTTAWQAWLVIIAYGLYYGLCEPAEKALVRDLAPPDRRGAAFGWYHGAVGVAAIPAGLLTGLLWEGFGAPAALWTGAAVAGLATLLLATWARPRLGPEGAAR